MSNINTAYLGLLPRAMQITPSSACPAPEINIDTEYQKPTDHKGVLPCKAISAYPDQNEYKPNNKHYN